MTLNPKDSKYIGGLISVLRDAVKHATQIERQKEEEMTINEQRNLLRAIDALDDARAAFDKFQAED